MKIPTKMDRQALVYQAKLAEYAERYDEMCEYMTLVARNEETQDLSLEERQLLSIAFRPVITSRRASWRAISAIEERRYNQIQLIHKYREQIEAEIDQICRDFIHLIDEALIPRSACDESKIFYLKMKGDYYRYLAEIQNPDLRSKSSKLALEAYEKAAVIAECSLRAIHPLRLGLYLNFSVFHYDILNTPKRAYALAKQAYDAAYTELDQVNPDTEKDSVLILRLLRDNLQYWGREEEPEIELE